MCAASQYYREAKLVVLAHLQAEVGKTYFYRTLFHCIGRLAISRV